MNPNINSLEKKLGKPDWKQWLPVYGVYQIKKDLKTEDLYGNSKPTLVDDNRSNSCYYGAAIYQAGSIFIAAVGVIYSITKFVEATITF